LLQPNAHQANASKKLRKCFFGFPVHYYALHLCIISLLCQCRFDTTRNQVRILQ
jgi:hypothetical protein